jgi:glycosyltransferase involved in cell wall biosynthesis
MGRPVVAFDVGGVREWLVDGQNGFVVAPRNVQELAERLGQLLSDERLRQAMGRNGVELARTRFNPKRHVDSMLALYDELLSDVP